MSTKTDHEVELEDLQILDECLACARLMLKGHIGEEKQRKRIAEKGEELPKRWQVSPAVARGLLTIVPKLQAFRRVLRKMPAIIEKVSKKAARSVIDQTTMLASFQRNPNISLT